jgi:uncharacterized protein (TIGR03118 family)
MNQSRHQSRRALCVCVASLMLVACGGGGGSAGSGYGGMVGGGGGTAGMGTAFVATPLVSDATLGGYAASYRDGHLVNPWGIAFNPQGFVWVANNGTGTSTLYDGNGIAQSLVVTTPPTPTGIVFNGTTQFAISQSGASGASVFLFATETGVIAGWSPNVNGTAAITAVDNGAAGSSYKGLALATSGGSAFVYAADFHRARVDVFDGSFAPASNAGAFVDPGLPAGYAPFGIQAIGTSVYVAYARQDAQARNASTGAGLGIVDVFDTAGAFVKRLVTGGPLNAPWGLAMAPNAFGPFGGALLVGNFGDGRINAFDPVTGNHLGTLSKADGNAIVIDGLWGIAFGNGINNQPSTTLFFAAGPNAGSDGVYGRIDAR